MSITTEQQRLQTDAIALHQALSQLLRVYQYRDRDQICCHDISVTQCHALELLSQRGPVRSQALAEALRLDKSTTTRVVDALVRKGYASRLTDPEDARARCLSVTPAGRTLYEQINAELVSQQQDILSDLDPKIRSAAIEVIRKLAVAANRRFGSAADCGGGDCGRPC